MKSLPLVFVFCLFTSVGFSQKPLISGIYDNFFADALGNFYTLKDHTICKYNPKGKKIHEYSDFMRGEISWLDVSNPLKILVYYKDFDMLIFLDNYLSPSSKPISLSEHDIASSSTAGLSHDNGIWVFDHAAAHLIRLNHTLNKTHESGNISLSENEKVQFIHQNNQDVLLVTNQRVFLFDQFATYKKHLPLPDYQAITWGNQSVVYQYDNQLTIYNYKTEKVTSIPFEEPAVQHLRLQNNTLYYHNKQGIFQVPFE
ncbi:MAG: hypothetical protein R6T91_02870 [Bacteroidales bacterium]